MTKTPATKKPVAEPKAARTLVECSPHRTTGGGALLGLTEGDAEYESRNEANAIDTMSLCHDVVSIASQPVTDTYLFDGKTRRYTPDFIVRTFVPDLRIEVKSVSTLMPDLASQEKYLAIAKMYREKGIGFAFLVDAQLEHQPRFDNVRLLQRYVGSPIPADVCERAAQTLGSAGPLSIAELQARASLERVDVLTLIAQRHLCFDWKTRLHSSSTIVSLPNQPYGGLYLADILRSTRFGDSLEEMALGRPATDKRLMAYAKTWRRPDYHIEPWAYVGRPQFQPPLRHLEATEQLPRSPERRRDFAPGRATVTPRCAK